MLSLSRSGRLNVHFVFSVLLFLALASQLVSAPPPSAHNVRGTVFTNGSTQVPNGFPVRVNNTVLNVSVLTFTNGPPPSPGSYSVSVNGSDGDNITVVSWNSTHYGINRTILSKTTTTLHVLLNISRQETNVSLNMSNDSVVNISSAFNFTANVSVIGGDASGCAASLSINGSSVILAASESFVHQLGSIPSGQHVLTSWNLSANLTGSVNITVNSSCSSDSVNFDAVNSRTAYNITVRDPFPPVIFQELPVNTSWLSSRNITLSFNVSDESGISNCSLYINGTINQSSFSVQGSVTQNFTLNSTPDGDFNWLVECFDNSTSFNRNVSSNISFHVDATGPNVTLFAPANSTASISNLLNFTFNSTDWNNITNCSLVMNGRIEAINSSIVQNMVTNFTVLLFPRQYYWYVNCSDNLSNVGQSEVRNLSVLDPDFFVNSSAVNLSNALPVEGELVQINFTVRNLGGEDASGVVISVYEDYALGVFISNSTVDISANSEVSLVVNWTAKTGLFNFTFVADPPVVSNGSVNESNESNNIGNRSLFLSSYVVYYGFAVLDIVLSAQNGSFIRHWLNKSNSSGNIYAAGTLTKGPVSWGSLQALGLSSDNSRSAGDWASADVLLNMSNYTDSLNSSYTFGSDPRNVSAFSIFSSVIQNVSVVNSTNTSFFLTGILWDTSDSVDGSYDVVDSEDLVFVSSINRGRQGFYGVYDYEIRVPAGLRRYRNSTSESVQFYIELN